MLPRLQTSYGSSGCSPHGFAASYGPRCGTGLYRFAPSMKKIRSPVFQAPWIILSHTIFASSDFTTAPVRGSLRSYVVPACTARMNSSVTATEMLKFTIFVMSSQVINSKISCDRRAEPHIRPAPRAALLDRLSRRIIERHERDRPRRDPGGRTDHRILWPQTGEREAGAATALVDQRHRLERVVDAAEASLLFDNASSTGNTKQGRELAEWPAGVHQGRRVRLEPPLGHQTIELLGHPLDRPVTAP